MLMAKNRALNALVKSETQFARRSASLCALNNAIALMAHDYKLPEVVQILRDHADQIESLG